MRHSSAKLRRSKRNGGARATWPSTPYAAAWAPRVGVPWARGRRPLRTSRKSVSCILGFASWRAAFPGHLSQTASESRDGGWRRSGAGCRAAQVQTGGPISIAQGAIVSRGSAAASVPDSSEVTGPRYKLDPLPALTTADRGFPAMPTRNPPEPSDRADPPKS